MKTTKAILTGVLAALLGPGAAGCGGDGVSDLAPRAGGDTTVDDRSSNAYSTPASNLDDEALEKHFAGDAAFDAKFVSAPAPVNPGLGPVFNNVACSSCHLGDGRGMPVVGGGPQRSQLLVRVSLPANMGEPAVPGGSVPLPGLGNQLQDQSIYGFEPEVHVAIAWEEQAGTFDDGTKFSLRAARFTIERPDGSPLPVETMTSPRLAPPVFGLGLLEAIPEDTILGLADPDDADGDGISGRANTVWAAERGEAVLGRFGLKANNPDLRHQVAGAYAEDMGVSNPVFHAGLADGEATDLDEETLELVTFYMQTLGVPARAPNPTSEILRGEILFQRAGCTGCHVSSLETGPHEVVAVANQKIHPYTDLLLHDMGEGLADGRPDFLAAGSEWRTAALWGLGLVQTVAPATGYLHDGRARTIEEAILWHGGEAEASRELYRKSPASERQAILKFLGSL